MWTPGWQLAHIVGPGWVYSLGYLLCAAALWWRRRAPLRVIAFIAAVDIAQFLAIGASQGLGAFLPMLAGMYALGRYAEPRELAIGAPLIVATMAVHEIRDPAFQFGGSAVSFWWVLPRHPAHRDGGADRAALGNAAGRTRHELWTASPPARPPIRPPLAELRRGRLGRSCRPRRSQLAAATSARRAT